MKTRHQRALERADRPQGCSCWKCDHVHWKPDSIGVPMARTCSCPTCGDRLCPGAVDHVNHPISRPSLAVVFVAPQRRSR